MTHCLELLYSLREQPHEVVSFSIGDKFQLVLHFPSGSAYADYLEQSIFSHLRLVWPAHLWNDTLHLHIHNYAPVLYQEAQSRSQFSHSSAIGKAYWCGINTEHGFFWLVDYRRRTITLVGQTEVPLFILGIVEHFMHYVFLDSILPVRGCSVALHKNDGYLFVADKFQGKTTVLLGLIRQGATYISNDITFLDAQRHIYPYPRPISVRLGTVLSYPELHDHFGVEAKGLPLGSELLFNDSRSFDLIPSEIYGQDCLPRQTLPVLNQVLFLEVSPVIPDFCVSRVNVREAVQLLLSHSFRRKADWVRGCLSTSLLERLTDERRVIATKVLQDIPCLRLRCPLDYLPTMLQQFLSNQFR